MIGLGGYLTGRHWAFRRETVATGGMKGAVP
jgi:hypothetical protein